MVCKVFSPKHKNDFAKECRAYHKLKGIMGISHLLCFGIRKSCHYIVIERMFSTLEDFSEDQPNQIDLALIAKLACTLVSNIILYYARRLTIAVVENTAGYPFKRNCPW